LVDDGRPAARCVDGTLLALGPRQFRRMLEASGWQGSDIVLLCDVAPESAAILERCLASLGAELGCEITTAGPADPGRGPVTRRRKGRLAARQRWAGAGPSDDPPRTPQSEQAPALPDLEREAELELEPVNQPELVIEPELVLEPDSVSLPVPAADRPRL